MSRRLSDDDLQALLDAAYAGHVHPVDVVRLVEEVRALKGDGRPEVIDDVGVFPVVEGYLRDIRLNENGLLDVTYRKMPVAIAPPLPSKDDDVHPTIVEGK